MTDYPEDRGKPLETYRSGFLNFLKFKVKGRVEDLSDTLLKFIIIAL